MNHWEIENAVHLGVALKEAGFQVSQICCSRTSCFDFAAKKDDTTILVKVNSDVDTFSVQSARELKVIAGRVSASSLVISQQTHGKPLEDDTVYSRNGIFVVTEKTIRNIALQTAHPLIYAGPGGYSVEVDGELVEKRRKELGLSIGKLAVMIGVSRRTLYGYERGMAKASVSAAYGLEWILCIPVAQSIDVFESPPQDTGFFATAKRIIIKHQFLQTVLKKLAQFNFDAAPTKRAPFDFIARSPGNSLNIVGAVPHKGERNVDQRTEEIVSFSKIVNAQPVFITDGKQVPNNGISTIHHKDLEEIEHPEEFIAQF